MSYRIEDYVYNELEVIGEGAYARVYLAHQNREQKEGTEDKLFAIKKLNLKSLHDKISQDKLVQEIELMQKLDHPHIIKYIKHIWTESNLYIVMEYCNNGDLEKYIYENNPKEEEVLFLFQQIISGVRYMMDDQHIFHRDIKPQNILMHDRIPKICDFSISRKLDSNNAYRTITGTPIFSSPQILDNESYTKKSEVWSLGITLYFMLFFRKKDEQMDEYKQINIDEKSFPWFGATTTQILKAIKTHPEVVFPPDIQVSKKIKQLICRMLQIKEEDRISCEELFQDELLVSYDKKYLEAKQKTLSLSFDQFNQSLIPEKSLLSQTKEEVQVYFAMIKLIVQIIEAQENLNEENKNFYHVKRLLPQLLKGVLCSRIQEKLNKLSVYYNDVKDANIIEYKMKGIQLFQEKCGEEFESQKKQVTKMLEIYNDNLEIIQKGLNGLEQPQDKSPSLNIQLTFSEMIHNPHQQQQIIQDNIKQLFLGMQEIHITFVDKINVSDKQMDYLRYLDDLITYYLIDSPNQSIMQIKSQNIEKMLANSPHKQMASAQSHYSRIVTGYKQLFG